MYENIMFYLIGLDNYIAVAADVANAAIQMAIDEGSLDYEKLLRVYYESVIDNIPSTIPGTFRDIPVVWLLMRYIFWSEQSFLKVLSRGGLSSSNL